mmetsp:Transcript_5586/g.14189  ORF Transcript_5586/g.14189 Transcript_5586/m.14189 type:complete len:411 (-) Transcript_5586:42-1274(-)
MIPPTAKIREGAGSAPGSAGFAGDPMAAMAASPQSIDALCEALLARLLPEILRKVEEVALSVASQAVQSFQQQQQQQQTMGSGTSLGALQQSQAVSVDWTFGNTSARPWRAGARLRFLSGRLCPPPGYVAAASEVATPSGGRLAVQASMVVPQELGPCEAEWQLEGADGAPLSPPMTVHGMVVATPTLAPAPALFAAHAALADLWPAPTAAFLPPTAMTGSGSTAAASSAARVPSAIGSTVFSQSRGQVTLSAAGSTHSSASSQAQAQAAPPARSLASPSPGGFASAPPAPGAALSSGYRGAAQQMTGGMMVGSGESWRATFEAFFGRDTAGRLRQGDPKEPERMVHRVWEHASRQNLVSQGGAPMITFDEPLARLFGLVVPPGTSRCSVQELPPLTQRLAATYLDSRVL